MPQIPAKKLKALADRYGPKKKRDDEEEREAGEEKADRQEDAGEIDPAIVSEEGEKINDGKQDGQLRKLMRDFDPEDNPPEWVQDEAKWEKAKEAVDPEGDGGEKYDEPWAVVAHVYKRMGGKIKGGGNPGGAGGGGRQSFGGKRAGERG